MNTHSSLVEQQVVCPHCWHSLYGDQALYISRHPGLIGDPVVSPDAQKRFSPKEIQQDRTGAVLDPNGWEMTDRACPLCHLQIPSELLSRKPLFISVVGSPQSGKTYFLTAMMHILRTELAQSFAFSLHDSDSHDAPAFLEHEKKLFFAADPNEPTYLEKTQERGDSYNTVKPDGTTEVLLPKPFIFSLQPTETNIALPRHGDRLRQSIVLYDNAGESFALMMDRRGTNNRVTEHLSECNGVMFALDPLQDPTARTGLMAGSQDPQLRERVQTHRQVTILAEMIHRIRRYRRIPEGVRFDVPLAVCVLKYDAWKPLVCYSAARDGEFGTRRVIDDTSVEFFPQRGIAGLDVEEINAISLLVRKFINEQLGAEFVALAEANFKTVRYFPISALGCSPNLVGDHLMVVPSKMRPFRVTHPLLWLLWRWGLIYRTKPRAGAEQRYRNARIDSCNEDRIRIVSPESGELIALDKEYAGSSIVDPTNGEMIWIPAITGQERSGARSSAGPQASPPPPPPRAVPPTPPPQSFILKLDETPIRGKRGKKK